MKKLFTLLFALLANVGMMKAAIETGSCGNNLTWTLNTKDSTLTIEGTGDMSGYEQWVDFRKYIAYVILPEGLTSVSTYAFNNFHNIRSISIPNSVKSLGYASLALCSKLTTVTIGTGISSFGGDLFASSPVKSLTIYATTPPSGGAGCAIDAETCLIYVPGESIEAYRNKVWWEEVVHLLPIPCTLASGTCGDNLTWELSCDSVLTISGTGAMTSNPWISYRSSIATVIINEGATSIEANAFWGCRNLTSIEIPNSVTTIGSQAFQDCIRLTSVTIPNSVTSIGWGTFSGCTGFPIENSLRYADTYLIEAVDKSLSTYSIKKGTKWIGVYAFNDCINLTSIEIPNSIISIGDDAFWGCTSLTSINVDVANSNYYSVDGVLFSKANPTLIWYPCGKTENSYTIPDNVLNIGRGTFYYCSNLTSITFPNSIISIGGGTFNGCTGLTSITCKAITPPTFIGDGCFIEVDKSIPVYVPGESIGAYKGANVWKDFTNLQPIPGTEEPYYPITIHLYDSIRGAEVDWARTYEVNPDTAFFGEYNYTSYEYEYLVEARGVNNQWTLVARSTPRYKRHGWLLASDFVTSDSLFLTVHDTTDITLVVASRRYSVHLKTNNYERGLVSIESWYPHADTISDDYWYRDTALIEAIPQEGYRFDHWSDGNMDNPRYLHMLQDYDLTAYFESTACSPVSGTCGNNLTWELSCDSVLTISGNGEMPDYEYNSTPWFDHRDRVKTIIVGDNVTTIGQWAFGMCDNLDSISIGRNVTYINNYVLYQIKSLRVITCYAENPPQVDGKSLSLDPAVILYVPGPSINAYRNAYRWKTYNTVLPIPGTEVACEPYIFPYDTIVCARDYDSWHYISWREHEYNIDVLGTYHYYDSLLTVDGCDSIYELNLTVLPSYNYVTQDTISIVRGESVIISKGLPWQRIEYPKETTIYGDTMFTVFGCDSMVSHYVIVAEPSFPVIFLDYNSNVLSEQNVEYNQAAKAPEIPAREGYMFVGWNVDIEHIVAPTYAIALYDKIGGTLTYLSEEGDVIATENVDLHLPAAPIIAGKSFKGWLTESADAENGIVLRATYTSDNPTTHDDVTITPSSNSAYVIFPFITGALTYQLVIRDLFGNVVCKIMFSATGHLLGVAFAPSRNRTQQQATETTGFNFTVEGLDANTTYEYEFVANDETDEVIETLSGSFTTKAENPTDNEQVNTPSAIRKYLEDGHLMINANAHIFDTQGKMIK